MKVQVQNINDCRVSLTVEILPQRVKKTYDDVLRSFQKKAAIPGFRAGKVPLKIVESRFAKDIQTQVINDVVPEVYREAVQEQKLAVVSDPIINKVDYNQEKGITFTAEVDIFPKIILPEYKKVSLEKDDHKVEEQEIQSVIEDLRARYAQFIAVPERELQRGDFALIDYKMLDDKDLPLKENVMVQVREEAKKGDFDDQLLGLKPGQARTVTMEEKEGHSAMSIEVVLKEIKQRSLPDLNDEFLKNVGGVDSIDDLKNKIKSELESSKSQLTRQRMKDQIMKYFRESTQFDVPQSQVESQIEQIGADLAEKVKKGEIKEEQFHDEQFKKEIESEAKARVRVAYVLHEICKNENMRPEDEEINKEIEKLSGPMGKDVLQLRKELEKSGRLHYFIERIGQDKVIDFIIEHAIIKTK